MGTEDGRIRDSALSLGTWGWGGVCLTLFTCTYPADTRCSWRKVDLPAVRQGQGQWGPMDPEPDWGF